MFGGYPQIPYARSVMNPALRYQPRFIVAGYRLRERRWELRAGASAPKRRWARPKLLARPVAAPSYVIDAAGNAPNGFSSE